MKTLIHYNKQRLEELINRLSLLNTLYIDRSFSFDAQLIDFMRESEMLFEELGESGKVSQVSQLNIYFVTAQKGINPQTLEKLRIGKRENIWIASYHVLDGMSDLMQASIMKVEGEISQATELIEQVILSVIQSGLIGDVDLKELHDQESIKKLWNNLTQNEQVKLIERKLKLSVMQDDIIIICDKVCSRINA